MHFADILRHAGGPLLSFEFFPPRSTVEADFDLCFQTLAAFEPHFVSVTCGAGGSSQDATLPFVTSLARRQKTPVVPHLTCAGKNMAGVGEILRRYEAAGIRNLLALRGDPPSGNPVPDGDFRYAADLVNWIRRDSARGRAFGIGVAGFPEGHPSTPNRLVEMDYLKAKVDAGADYICTQLFFENHDFYDFRDRCSLAGINVPVIAGIFPLTAAGQMKRMAELAGRMRYPASLLRALRRADGNAETFRQIALHQTAIQCHDLLNHGVAGLHFYTLNQKDPVSAVLTALGLPLRR
jgi:methylenetetrahydrofolate reductase (NADPH)